MLPKVVLASGATVIDVLAEVGYGSRVGAFAEREKRLILVIRFRAVCHQGHIARCRAAGRLDCAADRERSSVRKARRRRRQCGRCCGELDLAPVGHHQVGIDGPQPAGKIVALRGVIVGGAAGADLSLRDSVQSNGIAGRDAVGCSVRQVAGHSVGAKGYIVEDGRKLCRQWIENEVGLSLGSILLVH